MSLTSYWLGEKCGVDIYETPDEQTWVDCEVKQARIRAVFAVPILIIIILLLIFFGNGLMKWGGIAVCVFAIAGILFSAYFFVERTSRIEHRRIQNKLKSYMKDGMSRSKAIRELKEWELTSDRIAVEQQKANSMSRMARNSNKSGTVSVGQFVSTFM
jgi:hypothetical protein